MIPARPDVEWFRSPLKEGETAWILESHDPTAPGHRDACIGNGLIGARIGAWGDASDYSPGPGSFIAGLWGPAVENPARGEGLAELPHWATLRIFDGDEELRRAGGAVSGHRQSLDLRAGTVRTGWRRHETLAALEIKVEAWAARADPHIAVLEAQVAVLEGGGRIFADEFLDSLHMAGTRAHRALREGADLCMEIEFKGSGSRLAVRSRLLPHGDCVRSFTKKVTGCDRVIRRRLATEKTLPGDRLWRGWIECGHPRLQQMANASLYHLYSSLRDDRENSHAPCGLFGNGWDGLVF